MNVVVKRNDDLNLSKTPSNNFLASILNDSQTSFQFIEEEDEMGSKFMSSVIKPKIPMTTLTRVFSNMSVMNLSGAYSPIVVETSILISEASIKEEINPLEPADTKLAFTSSKNLIIGIIMLLWFVIPGSWVGPIIMSLPAKNPFIKSSWRTQSNLILTLPLVVLLYMFQK